MDPVVRAMPWLMVVAIFSFMMLNIVTGRVSVRSFVVSFILFFGIPLLAHTIAFQVLPQESAETVSWTVFLAMYCIAVVSYLRSQTVPAR
jgi:ACR3 family arsenite efflux pump ArsB